MPETNISAVPFDGHAAWSALPAHVRDRIGGFALELAVGFGILEHAGDPASRAGAEAARFAGVLLREAVLGYDGLRDEAWIDPVDGREAFRLPTCLGRACETCGCSHYDPCETGCGWHSETVCTACAEAAPGAAAVPDLSPTEVEAVCKGACKAVRASALADLPTPSGGLRALATAIDGMHGEGPS